MSTMMLLFSVASGAMAVGAWLSQTWPWLVLFAVFGALAVVCMVGAAMPDRRAPEGPVSL